MTDQAYHRVFTSSSSQSVHSLNQDDAAENAYEAASQLKPNDSQALKGLISLYEKQSSRKLDSYHGVVLKLGEIYAAQEDAPQCQGIIDKYEAFAKSHGSRSQYLHALELLTPDASSLYNLLEEAAEAEEKEWINKEIGERRTRLGAKIDQVKLAVNREAFARFPLEDLYRKLIDWSNDDEVRFDAEEKLLHRAYNTLVALPNDEKPPKRDEVLNLANGMVIVKRTFILPWKIALEWVDAENSGDWEVGTLRQFIELFPEDGLSKVLKGYLDSDASPFPRKDENGTSSPSNDEGTETELSQADRLILMAEGLDDCSTSLLAHRLIAEVYLSLEEFGSAVESSTKAQQITTTMMKDLALGLQDSIDSINTILATAMISYQSPRYHPEAKRLFENIIKRKPDATASLLGVGMILREDEDHGAAISFLEKAMKKDSNNLRVKAELAWCRALSGDLSSGLSELQETLAQVLGQKPVNLFTKSETLYRIGYCTWNLDESKGARKDREGAFRYFMDSLKTNPNYAPAYTSLGIYFEDYSKNRRRARTAFQKAFELSTSEIEAGERLARAYANSNEWELVELVAQRVVDSGKARPAPGSKKKAYSWPYAALGVSELNKQQYAKSIVSFQSALRIAPNDYNSWVGLAESYQNSGRYVAATRAFAKAESLEDKPKDERTWFARYMLANVNREMGLFDVAIEGYEAVLSKNPDEFGVSVTLLQTLSEYAWANIQRGLLGEAAKAANKALDIALAVAPTHPDVFNLWKAAGDACSVFSIAQAQASGVDSEALTSLLGLGSPEALVALADIDQVNTKTIEVISNGDDPSDGGLTPSDRCILASIVAYKRAVHLAAHDRHARAVFWYNLGWAEYQAFRCASSALGAKAKKKIRRFLKAAVRSFKRAIELEASNSEFWNALGVATTTMNPTIAQHAFVRSLHLNERSAKTWTNLGVLYMTNGDNELANEAFTRAQSSDPDFAQAWLGQGLLASLYGDSEEARGLFTHTFDIANSESKSAKKQYSMSVFDHISKESSRSNDDAVSLIQPLFALNQLRSQSLNDVPFEHLTSLFAERTGDHDQAVRVLEAVCTAVEKEFEASESVESLLKFSQAKADLARVCLARSAFEDAVNAAETSLDMSAEDAPINVDQEVRQRTRLSAHLTAGLAHYFLSNMDQAISNFQSALQEAEDDPDVVCLLAQVLWAKGGEAQDVAREQLYGCVEKHPEHVGAVTLLAVIALLDGDEDGIEVAREDLENIRCRDAVSLQDLGRANRVLAGIRAVTTGSEASLEQMLSEATRSVMLAPAQPQGWMELAEVASNVKDSEEAKFPSNLALKNALRSVPPRGTLEAEELARIYAAVGTKSEAQVGIVVSPWKAEGWRALADSSD
ncbi:MAG: hypothetical protein Q9160_008946 [Pyrenula sp. 1 TL-2023]